MTTGQKTTGGLREAAEAARQASRTAEQERRRDEREKSLDKVIDKFFVRYGGFGQLINDGLEIDRPARDEYQRLTEVPIFSGGRQETTGGWMITLDGVDFLFGTTYGSESLYLLHTCPDCGVMGASTFHGLDDLGRLLKSGPTSWAHRCRERETRAIAYAIGTAARDLRLSEATLIEETLELHGDLIARLRFGR